MRLKKIIAIDRGLHLDRAILNLSRRIAVDPRDAYLKAAAIRMMFLGNYWPASDPKTKEIGNASAMVMRNARKQLGNMKLPSMNFELLRRFTNPLHVGGVTLPASNHLHMNMDYFSVDKAISVSDGVSIPPSPTLARLLVDRIKELISTSDELQSLDSSNHPAIARFIRHKICEAATSINVKNQSATLNLNLVFRGTANRNFLFSYNAGDSQTVIFNCRSGQIRRLNPMFEARDDLPDAQWAKQRMFLVDVTDRRGAFIPTATQVEAYLKHPYKRNMADPGDCIYVKQRGFATVPDISMTVAELSDDDRALSATDGVFDNWEMEDLADFLSRCLDRPPREIALLLMAATQFKVRKDDDMTLVYWNPAEFVINPIPILKEETGCSCRIC